MNNISSPLAPYGSFKFIPLATKVGTDGKTVPSDIRCKKEIRLLSTLENGIKIYSFKYLWSEITFVGIMAQDLLAHPEWKNAVHIQANGLYGVDYAMLGLKMTSLDVWNKTGPESIKLGSGIPLLA